MLEELFFDGVLVEPTSGSIEVQVVARSSDWPTLPAWPGLDGTAHGRTAGYRRRENQLACRPFGTVAGIATLARGGPGKSAASQMYSHERSLGTDLARVM